METRYQLQEGQQHSQQHDQPGEHTEFCPVSFTGDRKQRRLSSAQCHTWEHSTVAISEAKREMPPASLRLVYVAGSRTAMAVEQGPLSEDHKGK